MTHSKPPIVVRKPSKDFPLFPHASGRWAKKIRGQFKYFGKTADDPTGQAALSLWLEQKDDLLAGRKPREQIDGALSVGKLCNQFLDFKQKQVKADELKARSWKEYKWTCDRLVRVFNAGRAVSDLRPEDFAKLREDICAKRGAVGVCNEIQRVRVILKFAFDAELIEHAVRYGGMFERPSRKVLRVERAARPKRLFSADAVRVLLDNASQPLRAMILLGLNCGLGNHDCCMLEFRHLNLESGWLDFTRPKTGIERRCPLWPETVAALREAIACRRAPSDEKNCDLVFISSGRGAFSACRISEAFAGLLEDARMKQVGVNFYALRHTHRTISSSAKDEPAADLLMGHVSDSMAANYVEHIDDERLTAVADHVRAWLYPKPAERAAKPSRKTSSLRIVG